MSVQSLPARFSDLLFPRGDSIRRATVQLAALTVAMVLVMLLVLEGVVYVITRQTLVSSLETTLQQRSLTFDPTVAAYFHLSGSPGGSPPGQTGNGGPPTGGSGYSGGGAYPPGGYFPGSGNRGGRPGSQPAGHGAFFPSYKLPSDTSRVFLSPAMKVIDGDGYIAGITLSASDAHAVLRSGRPLCCDVVPYEDTDYLVYTTPLISDGKTVGVQQVSISEHQYEQTMSSLLRSLAIVGLLGLILAALISIALVRRALRPVHVAVQRQRDFVADAAHELRTPLAIMRTAGEVGLSSTSPDDLQETLVQMLSENQHLTRLVEDLSLLARTDTQAVTVAREPVDLSALVQDTAVEIGFLAEDRNIMLDSEVQPNVQVQGDALRLRQLLLILLDNALKHTPDGGTVRVRLHAAGTRLTLQVIDSGAGIPSQALSRIFDRFYRVDSSRTGEGSGLGLAIGRWIVESHAGSISAQNIQPHGASFSVQLPTLRTAAGATPAPATSATA